MANQQVVGEAGVRIRPITKGFLGELRGQVEGAASQATATIPIAVGSQDVLDRAISEVKAKAETGVSFPVTTSTGQADASIATLKKQVTQGAELPVTAATTAAEGAVEDVKALTEVGAELPVTASTAGVEQAVADARRVAGGGAELPVTTDPGPSQQVLAQIRTQAQQGAEFPVDADPASARRTINLVQQDASRGVTVTVDANDNPARAAINIFRGTAQEALVLVIDPDTQAATQAVERLQSDVRGGAEFPVESNTESARRAVEGLKDDALAGVGFDVEADVSQAATAIDRVRSSAVNGVGFGVEADTGTASRDIFILKQEAAKQVDLPIISSGVEDALANVASVQRQAEDGAVLPIEADTLSGIAAVDSLRTRAEDGVVVPVGADETAALDTLASVRRNADTGITVAVQANDTPARSALAAFRSAAQQELGLTIDPDVSAAQQAVSSLQISVQRGAQFPVDPAVQAAQDAVSGLRTAAEGEVAFPVTANVSAAEDAVSRVQGAADDGVDFRVGANVDGAFALVTRVRDAATETATVPVEADVAQALGAIEAVKQDSVQGTLFPVTADVGEARSTVEGLKDDVQRTVEIPVVADVGRVATSVNQVKLDAAGTAQIALEADTSSARLNIDQVKADAAQTITVPLVAAEGAVEDSVAQLRRSAEVGVEMPVTASVTAAEDQLSLFRTEAAGGADVPLTADARGATDALRQVRGLADAGITVNLFLDADTGPVRAAISDVKAQAIVGSEFPLAPIVGPAQDAIRDVKAQAQTGADVPLTVTSDFAEDQVAALRGAAGADVSVPISLDPAEFLVGLQRLQDTVAGTSFTPQFGADPLVDSFGRVRDGADSALGGILGLGGGIDDLQGRAGALTGTLGGLASRLTTGPGALVGGGIIGGALLGGGIIAAGNQRLTTIEDSVAALEIQLGGAEQAAKVVDDVLNVVRGTPFNLDQFVQAARTMISFGVATEKVPGYLTAIGEAAAGSGQGLEAVSRIVDVFSQVSTIGRITTDDVYRLQAVGVDALKILGNYFGKTTAEMKEMVSDGAVPAEEALDAISAAILNGSNGVNGATTKLGGSMEKLRTTFSGAAGGLSAAVARLGAALLEPFREDTVKLLTTTADTLDKIAPSMKEFLGTLSDTGVIDSLASSLSVLPDFFADLSNEATPAGQIMAYVTDLAAQAIRTVQAIAGGLVSGFGDFAKLAGGVLVPTLKLALDALQGVFGLLERIAPVIKPIIPVLAAAFAINKIVGWATQLRAAIVQTQAWALATGQAAAAQQRLNAELSRQRALLAQSSLNGVTGAIATPVIGREAEFNAAQQNVAKLEGQIARLSTTGRSRIGALGGALFSAIGGWPTVAIGVMAGVAAAWSFYTGKVKEDAKKVADEITQPLQDFNTQNSTLPSRLNEVGSLNSLLEETNTKVQTIRDQKVELPSFKDLAFNIGGIPGALNEAAFSFDEWYTREQRAAESSKETQKQLAEATKGWLELGEAIDSNARVLEQLGAVRETDAQSIQKNQQLINSVLAQAVSANDDKQTFPEIVAERIKASAAAAELAQYDFDSLGVVLSNAGLTMEDLATKSVPEIERTLQQAAAATAGAKAEAVGLTDEMGKLAAAYEEAQKAGEQFTQILFLQGNRWLESISGIDNFNFALSDLKYTTDFTSQSLSSLSNSFQQSVADAYANALTDAGDAADGTSQAMEAAAGRAAALRDNFVEQAVGAGYARDEAETLATALFGLPQYIPITIEIQVLKQQLDAAIALLDELKQRAAEAKTEKEQLDVIKGAIAGTINAVDAANRLATAQAAPEAQAAQDAQKRAQAAAADLVATQNDKRAADERRRAAEQAAKEAEREAERRRKEAERLAEEARREQERRLQEFFKYIENLVNATESLTNSFEATIKKFTDARDEIIGQIRKRTEFQESTSVSRLIRNASQRNQQLGEAQQGIQTLRQRGLSESAIRAVGLQGRPEDLKQIRKLLRASPEELQALSSAVGTLSDTATQAAYREQGQIIAGEIRAALERFFETPGARERAGVPAGQTPNAEAILLAFLDAISRGTPPQAAAQQTSLALGGIAKR